MNYVPIRSIVIACFGLLLQTAFIQAGPACPYPFLVETNESFPLREIFFHGTNPYNSFLTDEEGHTLVEEEATSKFVYATRNNRTGELGSSGILLGEGNPVDVESSKGILPGDPDDPSWRRLEEQEATHHRRLSLPPKLKNLVILVRFSDHKGRDLPSRSEFDILFNQHDSKHATIAPTGSVKDVFRINSYGKFILESVVFGWIELPNTETWYADGVSGFGSTRFFQALHIAMNKMRDDYNINFHNFDADRNGRVDMVTLIHSGYAAEIYGKDQYGTPSKNRIWSHRWKLPSKSLWYSGGGSTGMIVDQYSTSPALFGLSGSKIGRIGVIAHEIGHCLGLVDLYGTSEGNGIGSYDMMSNHWGFSPYSVSQWYPPIMSPWTKMVAGWLNPIVITKSTRVTIQPSEFSQQIYRINMNNDQSEYLLIENRQAIGFDLFLPQAGLAIWHIDENAIDIEGYPGQDGVWPYNGKHYRVALLQADGSYDLERRKNHGDRFDLFHGTGVDLLGPSLDPFQGPFPNTDAYAGIPSQTGIRIRDISRSSWDMQFTVDFLQSVSTTFIGGNGASGNMFNVFAKKKIVLRMLYLHIDAEGPTVVELWMRTGSHVTFESKPWLWQRRISTSVDGKGRGKKSNLDVGRIILDANTLYSFYVVNMDGKFRYTNGNGVGTTEVSNSDLTVFEGVGLSASFNNVFQNRIWNGVIFYELAFFAGPGRRLATGLCGSSGQDGVTFDIVPYTNLNITAFDLHLIDREEVVIRVFNKLGSFDGTEADCKTWKLVFETKLQAKGMHAVTTMTLPEDAYVPMRSMQVQSFYVVVVDGTGLRYNYGQGSGTVITEDDHIAILEGYGMESPCGSAFWNDRAFDGAVHYRAAA